jgi:predicted O-methyltransferase YrrM
LNFFLLKEYLQYFHFKTDEHSLHSPFIYQFYHRFIKDKAYDSKWETIEDKRNELLKNKTEYKIFDLGAGSKIVKSPNRKVKSIAQHSLSSAKFSQFLYRIIQYFNFNNIVELGTSLGINTSYLSRAKAEAQVFTFEADSNAIRIAKEVNNGNENIKFITGDIAKTLPELLLKLDQKVDLVYADANHTYEASIQYFNFILPYLNSNSIYIMDDIHWSKGMKKAWMELKESDTVTFSIDLFDAGILFFNPDFEKQHYVLDF